MRRFLNHLPIQIGIRTDRRLRPTHLKHAQFASFLEESGFRTPSVDHHERSVRRRRIAKGLLMWLTAFAGAWVALESARAVSLF